MQQRRLGSSGIEVGAIGLGCMGMSWGYSQSQTDDAESIRVVHRALELGCTMLDTADAYGPFTNEELVGGPSPAGATRPSSPPSAASWCTTRRPTTCASDGRPEHVREACDASLRRLGIDTIDLYYLHRADPNVPLEESVGALAEAGRGRQGAGIGLSEVSVEQLEAAPPSTRSPRCRWSSRCGRATRWPRSSRGAPRTTSPWWPSRRSAAAS